MAATPKKITKVAFNPVILKEIKAQIADMKSRMGLLEKMVDSIDDSFADVPAATNAAAVYEPVASTPPTEPVAPVAPTPPVVAVQTESKDTEPVSTKANSIAIVGNALMQLAGMCDGAKEQDGAGFNKLDTGFGKDLAGRYASSQTFTERQFLAGKNLISKYRRQLGMTTESIAALEYPTENKIESDAANEMSTFRICIRHHTDKAWVVKTSSLKVMFIPKSIAKVEQFKTYELVQIPKWFVEKNRGGLEAATNYQQGFDDVMKRVG